MGKQFARLGYVGQYVFGHAVMEQRANRFQLFCAGCAAQLYAVINAAFNAADLAKPAVVGNVGCFRGPR